MARTVLNGLRVFTGQGLTGPQTVVIDGTVIGTDPTGADTTIEADGAVLIPGLIDAHVHLHGTHSLERLRAYGVTTALDMATWPAELVASLRGLPGLTDIRSPGTPAIGPGGMHAKMDGMPDDAIVLDPDRAAAFVADRAAEGVDYLKVIAEAPGAGGPDQPTMNALVASAHERGLRVVAHAAAPGAVEMALEAGADLLTHVPLGPPLPPELAERIPVAVPTLTMMEGIAQATGRAEAFAGASESVSLLLQAGVPILAGTDANTQPGAPFQVPHGESIHHELELLVAAGLSTVEALRSATSLPAQHFGLTDRGAIKPGLRADLVLLGSDPVADIRATRDILQVWCAGTQHTPH